MAIITFPKIKYNVEVIIRFNKIQTLESVVNQIRWHLTYSENSGTIQDMKQNQSILIQEKDYFITIVARYLPPKFAINPLIRIANRKVRPNEKLAKFHVYEIRSNYGNTVEYLDGKAHSSYGL